MFSPVFPSLPKILPWVELFTGCDTEKKHHWTPQERSGDLLFSWPQCWAHTSALGSCSCQSADCAHSSGCSTQQAAGHERVFWQGLFGVFIFRIIASSRIATCSEQCPFFGPRGGKGRRKHIFLWQMGFCFLSKLHMNIYSCLCSLTWMPGFDLRTNYPINSWMSEFNLHLSPLTFTLAFPFIIGDILTATFNKIRATESELDYEDRPRHRGMMCDPGQCRDLKSFWIRC